MTGRFVVGDVVVLNGHRLTVDGVYDTSASVALATWEARVAYFPQEWLPDPEPREGPEPEWQPGDVVMDADGFVFRRSVSGWWGVDDPRHYDDRSPARPLTRLVPEHSEWEEERTAAVALLRSAAQACPPGRAVMLGDLAEAIERGEHLNGGGAGEEPGGDVKTTGPVAPGLCNCAPDLSYPEDHAPWCESGLGKPYSDEEGDLDYAERHPEPALTPGMTVKHREGRLGVVMHPVSSSVTWVPAGDGRRQTDHPDKFRPVTLVEKPDQEAWERSLRAVQDPTCSCCDCNDSREKAYARLFPGGDS